MRTRAGSRISSPRCTCFAAARGRGFTVSTVKWLLPALETRADLSGLQKFMACVSCTDRAWRLHSWVTFYTEQWETVM